MTLDMMNDETLCHRYFEGDDGALAELMERYGQRLIFYINGYIHDLNDAEDLMIEAFAYLTIKKPRIREGAFKAYLFKTARHLALRFASKKRMRRIFSLDDLEKEPESGTLIEEIVQTEERDRILHLCMEQLHPDYREALYLVYFENMRHAEAAAILRKSEKQIADLLYRGRNSLRRRLEQEGITRAEY